MEEEEARLCQTRCLSGCVRERSRCLPQGEEDISFGIMVPRVLSPPPFIILQFPSHPRGVPDCVTAGVKEAAVEEATLS